MNITFKVYLAALVIMTPVSTYGLLPSMRTQPTPTTTITGSSASLFPSGSFLEPRQRSLSLPSNPDPPFQHLESNIYSTFSYPNSPILPFHRHGPNVLGSASLEPIIPGFINAPSMSSVQLPTPPFSSLASNYFSSQPMSRQQSLDASHALPNIVQPSDQILMGLNFEKHHLSQQMDNSFAQSQSQHNNDFANVLNFATTQSVDQKPATSAAHNMPTQLYSYQHLLDTATSQKIGLNFELRPSLPVDLSQYIIDTSMPETFATFPLNAPALDSSIEFDFLTSRSLFIPEVGSNVSSGTQAATADLSLPFFTCSQYPLTPSTIVPELLNYQNTIDAIHNGYENSNMQTGSNSSAANNSTSRRVQRSVRLGANVDRLYCPQCTNDNHGFSGNYELQRHLHTFHKATQSMYVVQDGRYFGSSLRVEAPLDACSSCRSGKRYHQVYNAASHLRRKHFYPVPRGRHPTRAANKDNTPCEVSGIVRSRMGGASGGGDPPINMLRDIFIREIVCVKETGRLVDGSGVELPEHQQIVDWLAYTGPH